MYHKKIISKFKGIEMKNILWLGMWCTSVIPAMQEAEVEDHGSRPRQKSYQRRAQWLTLIISATHEVAIGRLKVQGQPRQTVSGIPSQLRVGVCTSHPSYMGSGPGQSWHKSKTLLEN
jgi:hypothetical protein